MEEIFPFFLSAPSEMRTRLDAIGEISSTERPRLETEANVVLEPRRVGTEKLARSDAVKLLTDTALMHLQEEILAQKTFHQETCF